MKKTKHLGLLLVALGLLQVATAAGQVPIEVRADWNEEMEARMRWWREARYGMFIHWGVYSVLAGEWDGRTTHSEWIMRSADIPFEQYEAIAASFNPVEFDADEWVRIAQEAGMRYMVITTKHHDGFAMFDSAHSDYNIVDHAAFGRDPLEELTEAAARVGMPIGFYYSITDWHHPDFSEEWHGYHGNPNPDADLERYVEYYQSQIRELLSNYGPIRIMWFDDGGAFLVPYEGPVEAYQDDYTELIHSHETMELMRSLQPDILINDRLGHGTTDFMTPEMFVPAPGSYSSAHNFESCLTINSSWGHNKTDVNWMSPKEIVYDLVRNASMGGNYLLNVGPMASGKIDPVDAAILRGAGKWIHRNAEAIYGTDASPIAQPEWGRITSRTLPNGDTRLYLHVFLGERRREPVWGDELVVPGLANAPIQAYALTSVPRRTYGTSRRGNDVVVHLEDRPPDVVNTVIVLDVAGEVGPR